MLRGWCITLLHCALSHINKFIRTSTKVWDFPCPISCYHCHPQRQKIGQQLKNYFQYLSSHGFCPLYTGFLWGLASLWDWTAWWRTPSGTGEQKQLVHTDSWAKTWTAAWIFWNFHYVMPSRHIYESLKKGAEMRWYMVKMMFVIKYSYCCRKIGKTNIYLLSEATFISNRAG